jgi:hypothetical protein
MHYFSLNDEFGAVFKNKCNICCLENLRSAGKIPLQKYFLFTTTQRKT